MNDLVAAPQPPIGPLEVKAKTMTSLSISWKPPVDDGGSPVTGYAVAIKESRKTMWIEAASVTADEMSASVADLNQGAEYDIRVMARNDFGVSDPLQSEKPITVERPPSKREILEVSE